MDLLLIIGLVVWIANAVKKRKEAEKRRQSTQDHKQVAFEGMFDDASEDESRGALESIFPTVEVHPQQDPSAKRLESQLTTPQQRRHTLEPSRKAGHAHAETSMSGFAESCPPAPNQAKAIDLAAASPEMAFRFDPNRVREGLIYAEILGKPKALRR